MKQPFLLALALSVALPVYAQTADKAPVQPPRLPKAYKELQQQTKPPSGNWLLDANDDAERFRRLQVATGGTEASMFEIGQRLETVHGAITRGHWQLARHNWEKIRDRMNIAAMKRPARTANLEDRFLDSGVWKELHDALREGNPEKSRAAFLTARKSCMECHEAENVAFQNGNPVFDKTASFPGAATK